jgi:Zn-dependent M28 family amino/carboxypeptidase
MANVRLALVIIGVILCAHSSAQYDYDQVLFDLKELSSDAYEGRAIGTAGGIKARDYIVERFQEIGLKKLDTSYSQPFSMIHPIRRRIEGYNVIGWIQGSVYPDEYIVVSSHHDHMGTKEEKIFNGADDNASGTCAMLAMADYFKDNPPQRSFVFVSFDGEEVGLIGSKHFVDNLAFDKESIVMNINMDMVGRNDKNEIYLCGLNDHPEFKPVFGDLDRFADIKVLVGHDRFDKKDDWSYASDHGNFKKKGIPYLYVGEEDHKDYHRPTDTFERIDQHFYRNVISMVLDFCLRVDHY